MSEKESINLSKLFWYIVIFSIIGLIVETLYSYITTGIIESRKGLIIGPFCPVYGVGAAVLILATYRFKDSNIKIFTIGAIVGGAVEYILSFGLEAIYGVRFWEYSYLKYNLNGRICIIYSIFWGILSVLLIKYLKPKIDNIIERIPKRGIVEIALCIFLILDVLITIWGVTAYEKRVIHGKSSQGTKGKIEQTLFPDELMVKIFPNLRYKTEEGNEIFVRDLL